MKSFLDHNSWTRGWLELSMVDPCVGRAFLLRVNRQVVHCENCENGTRQKRGNDLDDTLEFMKMNKNHGFLLSCAT